MSKFAVKCNHNPDGLCELVYEGASIWVFRVSELADLASCVQSALSGVKAETKCKCDLPEIANINGSPCPEVCSSFDDNNYGICLRCEHNKACHS